jgi:hypothetical protein
VFFGIPETRWAASKERGLPQLSSILSRTIHLVASLTTAHFTANRTRSPLFSLSYYG